MKDIQLASVIVLSIVLAMAITCVIIMSIGWVKKESPACPACPEVQEIVEVDDV